MPAEETWLEQPRKRVMRLWQKKAGKGAGSDQISRFAQSCPTLCDSMNHSTPGLPVHHQLPEFTETHGGVFQAAVTPAVGLPDTVQDVQLKPNFRSTTHWFSMCAKSLFQSCPTLCDPMPGSSVHGILQVTMLDWAATPSSRRSSLPRDGTCFSYVPCVGQVGSLPHGPPGLV